MTIVAAPAVVMMIAIAAGVIGITITALGMAGIMMPIVVGVVVVMMTIVAVGTAGVRLRWSRMAWSGLQ